MKKEYKVLELTLSGVDVYLGTYSSNDTYDSSDREYVKSEPLEDVLNELAKENWEVESMSNLAVILSRVVKKELETSVADYYYGTPEYNRENVTYVH